jgi:hypothetical protein
MGLFGFRKHPKLALMVGALPDLLSFGILLVIRLVDGTLSVGKPALETIPGWTFMVYDSTHSLLVAGAGVALAWAWRREVGFAFLAWPMHIILDIPFHAGTYFPTKMFWPVSSFHIDGIPWTTPWIWFPNLAGLMILYGYRLRWKGRRKQGE